MGPKPRELDQPDHGGGVLAEVPETVGPQEKIGFGLRGVAEFLMQPHDARGCRLAPRDVTLILEDGLLMALGPDGDPVPPDSFVAAAALLPDQEVAWRGGPPLAAHRVADALAAQTAARHRGEPMGEAWLLAMLGIGPQPEPATEAWLRAEQLYCDLTAIGDELLVSPTGAEAFLVTDVKGETIPEDDAGRIRIDGGSLSAAGLADRVRAHVLSRGEGPVEPEMVLSDCTLGLHHQMLVLRTPFADVELLQGLAGHDTPAVRIFLANGRPVGPGALSVTLGHPSRTEEPASEEPARSASMVSPTETLDEMSHDREIHGPQAEPVERMVEADPPPRTSAPTGRIEMIHLPLQPPASPGGVGTAVVVLAGLPAGATLSAGLADGDGRWLLQPHEWGELTLAMPNDGPETFLLEVTAISVLDRDGALASSSEMVTIARGTAPVPLHLDRVVPKHGGGRVDALVLRDLPPGAQLSAGTHDPAIRGWIVLPTQVPGLALIRSPAQTGASRVRVHGLSLQSAGRAAAKELARLCVIMA